MTETTAPRITATPAAHQAITALRAAQGGWSGSRPDISGWDAPPRV